MTTWIVSGLEPFASSCSTASFRCARSPILPAPSMAAIRSSQTEVAVLATREPPGSDRAFARHSGFTYPSAPSEGLSTQPPRCWETVAATVGDGGGWIDGEGDTGGVTGGVTGGLDGVPLQATPLILKSVGVGLLPLQEPLKPMFTDPPLGTDRFQSSEVAVTDWPCCDQFADKP